MMATLDRKTVLGGPMYNYYPRKFSNSIFLIVPIYMTPLLDAIFTLGIDTDARMQETYP
jgi:hypothetical protein